MKIAIEAQRIFRRNKHGMDFVVLEVLRQLQQFDLENEYHVFVAPGDDPCLQSSSNMTVNIIGCFGGYPIWEQWSLPHALRKLRPDLLHCTSNTAPLYCPVPLVLTLHDLFFLEPEEVRNSSIYQKLGRYYRRLIIPAVLPKCEHVITVSQYSYDQIQEMRLMDITKLSIVYNGYSSCYHKIESTSAITQKYTLSEKYYLYFGNTDPRKNTRRVVEAFCIYLQQSSYKYPLIITGVTQKHVNTILSELGKSHLAMNFICPGYVQKDDLPYLYNGAVTYLNPSLKEGFGIPILESMACGTPVITSNSTAMPEVAGDGAVLVDPKDSDAIASQLIRMEQDELYRQSIIAYGLERVKQFSWKQTALETLHIYQSVVNNHEARASVIR